MAEAYNPYPQETVSGVSIRIWDGPMRNSNKVDGYMCVIKEGPSPHNMDVLPEQVEATFEEKTETEEETTKDEVVNGELLKAHSVGVTVGILTWTQFEDAEDDEAVKDIGDQFLFVFNYGPRQALGYARLVSRKQKAPLNGKARNELQAETVGSYEWQEV